MEDAEPFQSESDATTQRPGPPVLDYTIFEPDARPSLVRPVLPPFALGALLPFVVLALTSVERGFVGIGLFVTCSECGVLFLAIELRGRLVSLSGRERPWWTAALCGAANTVAVGLIVLEISALHRFWPMLGGAGSIALAVSLVALVSVILAVVLSPRD